MISASAHNLDVAFGGQTFNRFEALYRPATGTIGPDWLGHMYLMNDAEQRRFDFADGTIRTTSKSSEGRWSDVQPLGPEYYGELRDVLNALEGQLKYQSVIDYVGELAAEAA
jgi:hypothetical protein